MIGYIYTITTDNGLYVGSTKDFKRRRIEHKSVLKNNPKQLVYKTILSNNGFYKITIYCKVNGMNEKELNFYEQNYMVILGSNLNEISSFQSEEEKKQYQKFYKKKYRNDNKVEIAQKQKDYHIINNEKRNKKQNEYYNINKVWISEKNKIKTICGCGGKYGRSDKSKHFKTKKHLNYIRNKDNHVK